jgi:hypothetical protein
MAISYPQIPHFHQNPNPSLPSSPLLEKLESDQTMMVKAMELEKEL